MWLSRNISTLLHIIAVWHISSATTGHFSLKRLGYSLSNSFLASNSLGSFSMLSDARCAYSCETNTLCKGFQFSDALKICNIFDTLPNYTDFMVSQATDVYCKKSADGTETTTTGKKNHNVSKVIRFSNIKLILSKSKDNFSLKIFIGISRRNRLIKITSNRLI